MSRRSSYDRGLNTVLYSTAGTVFLLVALVVGGWMAFNFFRVDVVTGEMAILIKKTGQDLENNQEVAPTAQYKGVQREFLLEGRHWFNPYHWDWTVIDQTIIEEGDMGVLVSLTGDDLKYGEFIAHLDESKKVFENGVLTKGIVPGVLRTGRYAINPYLFAIEIHKPVVISAGYYGVVTNLSGKISKDSNTLLVEKGERGVEKETLGVGTYFVNPYEIRVNQVDCRSQTFNLAKNKDMGFPSKDGFWVSLDGTIEFRVMPDKAAEVYVTFNDENNGERIDEEIISKVIMPIARSYCRVEGSKISGRDFIDGKTRTIFEDNFEDVMQAECEPLGIEVLVAKITKIFPPEKIAEPIRERGQKKIEVEQYEKQIEQQVEEQKLAVSKKMIERKQALVVAEQEVIVVTTEAMREQEVAIIKANEDLEVAKLKLEAAQDEAEAILSRAKAEADVVGFNNEAEAAGWKRAVEAFGGQGSEYAKYVLNKKLAPAYQRIMANTENSPIMKIFESFASPSGKVAPVITKPAVKPPEKSKAVSDEKKP